MTLTTAPLAVARSTAANALSDAGQVPTAAATTSNFSQFLGHRLSAADSAGRSLFNNALNAPSSSAASSGGTTSDGTNSSNAAAQAMLFAPSLPFFGLHRPTASTAGTASSGVAPTGASATGAGGTAAGAGTPGEAAAAALATPNAFANSAALALGNAAGASSATAPAQTAAAGTPSALANGAATALTNATANLISGAAGASQPGNGQPGSGQSSSGQPGSGQQGNGQPGNGQNGSAANPRILGAAELNARVAAAAPSYASQPAVAFANALHHINEQPSAAGPPTAASGTAAAADAKAAAAPATSTGIAPPTPQTPAALAANAARAAAGAADSTGSSDAAGMTTDPKAADDAAAAAAAPLAAAAQQPATGRPAAAPTPTPLADPTARAAAFLPAAQQVAVSLKQAIETGTGRIQIQLKPESLGAIDVKLDMTHDGRVSAVISADRSDTLNLLRQNSSGLEQALRNAGLQANSGSLSFNLRGDAQPSFSQNTPNSSGRFATAKNTAAATAIDSVTSTLRQHSGALNIEV